MSQEGPALRRDPPRVPSPRRAPTEERLLPHHLPHALREVRVESPRLYHCDCSEHEQKTFSPLTDLMSEHIVLELLYLETKWASLTPYAKVADLLKDVLPVSPTTNAPRSEITFRRSPSASRRSSDAVDPARGALPLAGPDAGAERQTHPTLPPMVSRLPSQRGGDSEAIEEDAMHRLAA